MIVRGGSVKLTAEQRKLIDELLVPIKTEAFRTDPISQRECVAAFNAAYEAKKLPSPEYIFCTSPFDALQKVESLADIGSFKKILGAEAQLHVLDCDQPYLDPLYEPINNRVDKALRVLLDLHNVVDTGLEKNNNKGKFDSMMFYGYESYWKNAENYGSAMAYDALGMIQIPRDYILSQAALATCGMAFSFERYCFISERAEKFHHPKLSKEDPRDRIVINWRDGFVAESELWY